MVVRVAAVTQRCALRPAAAAAEEEEDDSPRRLRLATGRCNNSPRPRKGETAAVGLEMMPGKGGEEEE